LPRAAGATGMVYIADRENSRVQILQSTPQIEFHKEWTGVARPSHIAFDKAGNAYVAEAKMQVMRDVSIDAPAGPSELLVLADSSADVTCIARELVAQAEHDPDAAVIAIVCGDGADACAAHLERALADAVHATPRADVVRSALGARGAIVTMESLARGIALANSWCAEHLLLVVRDEVLDDTVAALRNAGTVFVGENSSVAFGDYMTGANHVLPTAGAARCYSGLSTLDFVRWTTTQTVTRDAAAAMANDVGAFADAEGLPAHAAAARAWATTASPAIELTERSLNAGGGSR